MWREGNILGTLEDFILQYGAPISLFSNNAKSQIVKVVCEILRMYAIKIFQCEPHHQHQNFAERSIQEVKKLSTGASPSLWLLCVQYVLYLLNRLSTVSLQWKTPLEAATGQRLDVSALMVFHWYQPVYKSTSANLSPHPNLKNAYAAWLVLLNTKGIV
jgi:hypothetical protein